MKATVGVVWLTLLYLTSSGVTIGAIPVESPSSSSSLTREKRSSTCNQQVLENLIQSTQETCSHISSVDSYISHINTKNPIPVPSSTGRHGFKDILTHYNNDLVKAKTNTQSWRKTGDNVLGSVKQMIVAAQEFEPKFTNEFQRNQARVNDISKNHEDIGKVEAKIAQLREEIDEAKIAASSTTIASVLSQLESIIKTKEEEINTTITDHNFNQAKRELEELIKFFEFVRNEAVAIEAKTDNVRTKMTNFKTKVTQDAGAFKRHRTVAQEGISRLQREKTNNNNEISNIQTQINNLNNKITAERAQINNLNRQIQDAQRVLRETEDRIAKSMRRTRRKKKIGRFLTIFGGWVVGSILSHSALKKERNLANSKREFIATHNRMVQNLQSQITASTRGIAQFQTRISTHQTKSRELEQELQHFNNLDGNLISVEKEANSILQTIANAITGVSKMRDTFDAIKQNLQDTIEKAKAAKTAAEIRDISYFIYNEIDVLKCKWNQAKEKIISVGKCY